MWVIEESGSGYHLPWPQTSISLNGRLDTQTERLYFRRKYTYSFGFGWVPSQDNSSKLDYIIFALDYPQQISLCWTLTAQFTSQKINCNLSVWGEESWRGEEKKKRGSHLHTRSVLNLDGHLLSIHLDLSGVEITCTHTEETKRILTPSFTISESQFRPFHPQKWCCSVTHQHFSHSLRWSASLRISPRALQ